MKSYKMAGLSALLAIALLGSACTPAAAPTPTVDPNLLYTSAAQTVIAQLTQNAPPPTATPAPTNTKAALPTLAAMPTLAPLTTLAPLKTATLALGPTDDKCQYITQTPADYTNVKAGSTFNITWRIKNTGTTTWGTGYVYRFYAAVNKLKLSANGYDLTSTVLPNGEIELKATATASSTVGQYDANWVLTNPQGRNFCAFSIIVNVTAASANSGDSPTAAPAELSSTSISVASAGGTFTYNESSKLEYIRINYTPGASAADGTTQVTVSVTNNDIPLSERITPYIRSGSSSTTVDVTNFQHAEGSENYTIIITASNGAAINSVDVYHR
jgi:hypothetical protein